MNESLSQIKVKVAFNGDILVTYVDPVLSIDKLNAEMIDICHFPSAKPFTMKWIDDEGDPCTITNQRELDEALRLYELNEDTDMTIHVFPGCPEGPGCLCPGEDKSVYRRGARRWRKFYRINGHLFQPKRFSRRAECAYCTDRIWGLGRQGFKCLTCKLLVHKKCHQLIKVSCQARAEEGPLTPGLTLRTNDTSVGHVTPVKPATVPDRTVVFEKYGGKENDWSDKPKKKVSITGHTPSQPLKDISQEFPILRDSGPRRDKNGAHNGSHNKQNQPQTKKKTLNASSENGIKLVPISAEQHRKISQEIALPPTPPSVRLETVRPDQQSSRRQFKLSDFEMMKVIGRGSYAKVFLAELKETGRVYAMKVIKKELITDEEDIDWVQTEKHVFETATNHPFLVGLHSCFQTPSRLIFVIEFVNGGDLMFHMQRQRRLPEEHARFYSAEIILALNFLHRKGIIYRDLKLDNVLLDSDGHIRLTDYGMCKEGLNGGVKTGTFCGTPNYIAPEILRGEDYGFSVDWWALGVLMFEMLAGRSPFDIVGATDNPDQNTEDYLFQVILEKTIRIPRSISVKAASVLRGFLNKEPLERLGCHPIDGWDDITGHSFFKSIDWDLLESKQLTPPFKPKLTSDRAVDNFDPQFTSEQPILTPDEPGVLEKIDQSEFEGFEYVNPLLMSTEECV